MDENKTRALDAALSQIEKQFGKNSIMRLGDGSSINNDIDVVSTGSLGLDIALGIGGLPKGRIVEIYGPESSGKVLTHSIRLVEAKLVVVGAELASELHEIVDTLEVTKDDILWWADADTLIETGKADYAFTNFAEQINRNSAVCPQSARFIFKDDGLFYIFTSGTTGMPKAMNHHTCCHRPA